MPDSHFLLRKRACTCACRYYVLTQVALEGIDQLSVEHLMTRWILAAVAKAMANASN